MDGLNNCNVLGTVHDAGGSKINKLCNQMREMDK